MSVKTYLHRCLNSTATSEGRLVNGTISFLILFSIAVIPLHFFIKTPEYQWLESGLLLFDRITVSVFTIEFLLRIWVSQKATRFIFSWEGIVDLAAVMPFYLKKLGILASYELFILLRVLRILKFSIMYGKEQHKALEEHQLKQHGSFFPLPGEKIEHIVQKHPLVFLTALLMPFFFISTGLVIILFAHGSNYQALWFAFSGLCFTLSGMFFYKAWLDYQYDVIYITNLRVILQNHELFGSETNGLTYDSITNVVPDNRGFFRWIFGLGHIEIETANRDATIIFEDVQNPHRIVSKISANRVTHKLRNNETENDSTPPVSEP